MSYERDMDRIIRLGNEARNHIIRELIEKAEAEIKCDVLGHRMVPLHAAEWLRSQMEGGE